MSDLKTCLCGSDKVHFGYEPFCGLTFWRVMCDTCGTQTSTFDTKEEAAKVWNTRPAEDATDKEIERLKAENDQLKMAVHNLLLNIEASDAEEDYKEIARQIADDFDALYTGKLEE